MSAVGEPKMNRKIELLKGPDWGFDNDGLAPEIMLFWVLELGERNKVEVAWFAKAVLLNALPKVLCAEFWGVEFPPRLQFDTENKLFLGCVSDPIGEPKRPVPQLAELHVVCWESTVAASAKRPPKTEETN